MNNHQETSWERPDQHHNEQGHDHVTDLLSAYMDNRLTPGERLRVEAHLPNCPSCRARLESLQSTVALLHSLPIVPTPRPFYIYPETTPAAQPRLNLGRLLRPGWAYGYLRLATSLVAVLLVAVTAADALTVASPRAAAPLAGVYRTTDRVQGQPESVTLGGQALPMQPTPNPTLAPAAPAIPRSALPSTAQAQPTETAASPALRVPQPAPATVLPQPTPTAPQAAALSAVPSASPIAASPGAGPAPDQPPKPPDAGLTAVTPQASPSAASDKAVGAPVTTPATSVPAPLSQSPTPVAKAAVPVADTPQVAAASSAAAPESAPLPLLRIAELALTGVLLLLVILTMRSRSAATRSKDTKS